MQVSLVGQWVTEARSKLADQSLKIVEYHGGNRSRNVSHLAGARSTTTLNCYMIKLLSPRLRSWRKDATHQSHPCHVVPICMCLCCLQVITHLGLMISA